MSPNLRRRSSQDVGLKERPRHQDVDQRPLPPGGPGPRPSDQAALKCLYLVTRSLDPTGKGKARWAMRWKPALNAFSITFEGRISPAGN